MFCFLRENGSLASIFNADDWNGEESYEILRHYIPQDDRGNILFCHSVEERDLFVLRHEIPTCVGMTVGGGFREGGSITHHCHPERNERQ